MATVRAVFIAALCAGLGGATQQGFLLGQSLSEIEQRIVGTVEEQKDAAIDFLEKIVNINSGTMNHKGVREVGKIFQEELENLGFKTRWIPMEKANRAGHLFAERSGRQGKRLLLIGHLDTVFERDSPFQKFRRQGNMATGPGIEDMKGGDVVMLYALKALAEADALEDATIRVALIGDEENAGDPLSLSRGDLIEAAHYSDVALGFEGGRTGKAVVARRSSGGWKVQVTARPAHSSEIFQEDVGSGALYEAARILHAFYEGLREEYLTFSAGLILGGTTVEYDPSQSRGSAFGKSNVIPETAIISGDLRAISLEQREKTQERMRAIVSESLPHTSSEISFSDTYPPMSPTEANYELLDQLAQVSRDLGFGPVEAIDPLERGAADVSFAAPHVGAALDGLGATGLGGHTLQERIDLSKLPDMTRQAAIFIYRLTR
ncbi:MAG: M20/M25/M40 family metallo-hydrolase [Acidobacteriota bacterium]